MIILHNYAESPYAEKIRAMLGYTGLEWQSVDVLPQPPRPSLDPVLGGYRRIPVMQMGADYICDTRLIAAEIAKLANDPSLDHANVDAAATAFIDKAEGDLFFASIVAAPKGKMLGKLLMKRGLGILKFMKDRAAASQEGGLGDFDPKDAKPMWQAHVQDLEARLASQNFFGGDKPDIQDFAAFHTVWINSIQASGDVGDKNSNVVQWRDRIAGFGHGNPKNLSAEQSLAIAAQAEPMPIADEHQADGHPVSIAPADYMRAPTEGRLVGETGERWIIARDTEGQGTVHVHFPKTGYELT